MAIVVGLTKFRPQDKPSGESQGAFFVSKFPRGQEKGEPFTVLLFTIYNIYLNPRAFVLRPALNVGRRSFFSIPIGCFGIQAVCPKVKRRPTQHTHYL